MVEVMVVDRNIQAAAGIFFFSPMTRDGVKG